MDNSPQIRQALKRYMEDQALTAAALGPALGVSSSTSIRWCNGRIKEFHPSHWSKLKPLLSPYLEAPAVPDLREQVTRIVREVTGRVVPSEGPTRTCGLYGVALCASRGFRFGDVVPDSDWEVPQVPVPTELARVRRVSAFRAVDDSMTPTVQDGDTVFIDPDAEVSPGDVALVKYDDTVVCKRWQPDAASGRILLYSDAPGNPPKSVAESEVEWRVRVVYVQPRGKLL